MAGAPPWSHHVSSLDKRPRRRSALRIREQRAAVDRLEAADVRFAGAVEGPAIAQATRDTLGAM